MKRCLVPVLALMVATPVWAQPGQDEQGIRSSRPAARRSAAAGEKKSPNAALRELAQGLAVLLQDPQVRHLVKEQVGQKFDGDFEVLYRDLANQRLASAQTFRQALGGAVGRAQKSAGKPVGRRGSLVDLDALAAALPQLQISMPVGFEDWDAENVAPLVAFVPVNGDDNDLSEVEAYDAAGRRHLLDAQVAPEFPVVVVGLNERTDSNGYLRPEFVHPSSRNRVVEKFVEDPADPGGDVVYEQNSPTLSIVPSNVCDARTHAYGDQEIMYQVKINNDHEPWVKGSPEIYATYAFPNGQAGVRGQFFMSNVDNEGQWYTINGPLFYWHSTYGNVFAMAFYEQDGSNWGTVNLTLGSFSYTLAITDGDDPMGATVVNFLDPICGSYSTGDAEFKMRYQGTTSGVCGEASCVSVQGTYISHFTGSGCTGTESYYLPYDGYGYSCRTWNGTGLCGTAHRTVTNRSYRYNGTCYDAWPSSNTLTDFVTVYR